MRAVVHPNRTMRRRGRRLVRTWGRRRPNVYGQEWRFIRVIRADCLEARRISGEDVVVPGVNAARRFEPQSVKEVE
jgi:hypothetical protein